MNTRRGRLFRNSACLLAIILLVLNQLLWAKDSSSDKRVPQIKVGVLASGSVHWEVQTMQRYQLDRKNNIQVKAVPLGSVNALLVALQGGAVDMIVTDWVWVAQQFQQQRHYQFAPFSTSLGGLMVPADSEIKQVSDLNNKTLGVAGGAEGKSWILFKAYVKHLTDLNLNKNVNSKFVAPPLVNALLKQGKVDASLNFWHFNAQLNEQKYRSLISLDEILVQLGHKRKVPMLGYVFARDWAQQHPDLINQFLQASSLTKQLLLESDEPWQALKKLMRTSDQSKFDRLKKGFREGTPGQFSESEINAIIKINAILQQDNNHKIKIDKSIFWLTNSHAKSER